MRPSPGSNGVSIKAKPLAPFELEQCYTVRPDIEGRYFRRHILAARRRHHSC